MIQAQLKLKVNKSQEDRLNQCLFILTGVYNFAVKKIGNDAKDKVYHTPNGFQNMLANHSKKVGIPSHILQGTLATAYAAWQRHFKKIAKAPRLKGKRRPLNSIPLPDPIKRPIGNRIGVPLLGKVAFYKQEIKEGQIKCGRIIKRASGWYLCLVVDATPNAIPHTGDGVVGIDPGFKHLITLSTGEKVDHPRELEAGAKRLAQAQCGRDRRLAARIQERIVNRKKDRNQKLSRRLVAENKEIYFSKDNIKGIAKAFGKSVASSATYQLRAMLAYKCQEGGRRYSEVTSLKSTMTCSACGALTGPTGWAGLQVRDWVCMACGSRWDRDVNAALNTLKTGAGCALKEAV